MQPDPQHEPELPPGEDAERTREMMRGMQLATSDADQIEAFPPSPAD